MLNNIEWLNKVFICIYFIVFGFFKDINIDMLEYQLREQTDPDLDVE